MARSRLLQNDQDIMTRVPRSGRGVRGGGERPSARRGSTGMGIAAADRPDVSDSAGAMGDVAVVTPDYFKTMGLPLTRRTGIHRHRAIGQAMARRQSAIAWRPPLARTESDRPYRDLWKGQNQIRGKSSASSATCVSAVSRATDPRRLFPGGRSATTSLQARPPHERIAAGAVRPSARWSPASTGTCPCRTCARSTRW